MAQYPVPQFIEEEGKIVFFLTYRQFFLLIGGAVISFLLFYVLPFIFFVICSLLIMGLALAVAFLKINDMPVLKVIFNYFGFLKENKNYIWKKKP